MEDNNFKWYKELNDEENITQGDIIRGLPIIKTNNYDQVVKKYLLKEDLTDFELENEIELGDYVVLTQPCDLANIKPAMDNIILCRIYDVNEAKVATKDNKGEIVEVKLSKGRLSEYVDGRSPQFYVLNRTEDFTPGVEGSGMDFHVVNFNSIEKVPINVLQEFIKYTPKRLRLLPPYREHLAQAFAKYFMRIGLPSNIDKNEFKRFS